MRPSDCTFISRDLLWVPAPCVFRVQPATALQPPQFSCIPNRALPKHFLPRSRAADDVSTLPDRPNSTCDEQLYRIRCKLSPSAKPSSQPLWTPAAGFSGPYRCLYPPALGWSGRTSLAAYPLPRARRRSQVDRVDTVSPVDVTGCHRHSAVIATRSRRSGDTERLSRLGAGGFNSRCVGLRTWNCQSSDV